MTPEKYLDLIQSPPKWFLPVLLITAALIGVLSGVRGRVTAPADMHQALLVLAVLGSVVNAALTLLVFPYVFTFISRRFGAQTKLRDVRGMSAAVFVPTLSGLLLTTITGLNFFAALGGLLSSAAFIYGLSMTNDTDLLAAARHTLAVWGVIILAATVIKLALQLL